MLIDLIVVDDVMEALAVRAALEYWRAQVRMHLIGKASDLVGLMDGSYDLSDNILLMCHGSKQGFVLPELGKEIADKEPFDRFIGAADISTFLNLNGGLVVSTGCETGTKEFADVFLNSGANTYIAPNDSPEGDASLMYVLSLFYSLITGKNIKDAHDKASVIDQETEMFQMYV